MLERRYIPLILPFSPIEADKFSVCSVSTDDPIERELSGTVSDSFALSFPPDGSSDPAPSGALG